MREVEVGKVYRHFKGKYIFVENIGKYFDGTPVVIYKGVNDGGIFVRPIEIFLEEVEPDNPKNVTGQKYRFEVVDHM